MWQWVAAVRYAVECMADHVRPDHANQLWDVLLGALCEASETFRMKGDGGLRLAQLLRVVHVAAEWRGGSRLYSADLVRKIHGVLETLLRALQAQHRDLFQAATAVLALLCRVRSRLLLVDASKYAFLFLELPACPPGQPAVRMNFLHQGVAHKTSFLPPFLRTTASINADPSPLSVVPFSLTPRLFRNIL